MIINLVVIMMAAMISENAVFTRALGINKWVELQNSPKNILWYGGLFAWTSLVSTMINIFVMRLIANFAYVRYVRPLVFLATVLAVYTFNFVVLKFIVKDKEFLIKLYRMLPITTFNTALFSVFFILTNREANYGYRGGAVYSIGTSMGYILAILIIYISRKRLRLSAVPKSLKGTPILLIYIGLLSLALYGLIGETIAG